MQNHTQNYVTKKQIGGTVYTVQPIFREGCTETADEKMARLIEHETRLNPRPHTSQDRRRMV